MSPHPHPEPVHNHGIVVLPRCPACLHLACQDGDCALCATCLMAAREVWA